MTQLYNEYAQALFMLSLECGKTEEYASELKIIQDAFDENPEFFDLLTSPAIFLSERLDIIEKTFSSSVCENVCSFVKLLCEKKRLKSLNDCIKEYNKLLENMKNISIAKVISAIELTKDEKEKIISKLEKVTGKKITAHYVVDETIMGGIIVETDGKILDGSLRYKLKDVKDVMGR